MTTDTLRSVRSLPKAVAVTKPEARRAGSFGSLASPFLAGAVPIDGGWAPPPREPALADAPMANGEAVNR